MLPPHSPATPLLASEVLRNRSTPPTLPTDGHTHTPHRLTHATARLVSAPMRAPDTATPQAPPISTTRVLTALCVFLLSAACVCFEMLAAALLSHSTITHGGPLPPLERPDEPTCESACTRNKFRSATAQLLLTCASCALWMPVLRRSRGGMVVVQQQLESMRVETVRRSSCPPKSITK